MILNMTAVRGASKLGAASPVSFALRSLDCGPDVGESYLEAIFTPFFRGYATVGHESCGPGLAIARRVVESANGTITAKTEKLAALWRAWKFLGHKKRFVRDFEGVFVLIKQSCLAEGIGESPIHFLIFLHPGRFARSFAGAQHREWPLSSLAMLGATRLRRVVETRTAFHGKPVIFFSLCFTNSYKRAAGTTYNCRHSVGALLHMEVGRRSAIVLFI